MAVHKVEIEIGGRLLRIETGRLARQADGAALVQYGDTVILAAAASQPMEKDFGFFPLTIDYREKTSAVGKFPGGFFKREGRPTNKEVITARLIDRPTRPLFPKWMRLTEVQVHTIVLSGDKENDPDIPSMIGASAALAVSKIPFLGPTGSVRIGRIGGQFVVNPTIQQMAESDLDLVVSGTKDAIVMVEAGAKQVPEDVVLDALFLAHEKVKEVVAAIEELAAKVAPEKMQPPEPSATYPKLALQAEKKYYAEIVEKVQLRSKKDRRDAIRDVKERFVAEFGKPKVEGEKPPFPPEEVKEIWEALDRKALRDIILKQGVRIDGRKMDEVREISCEVNLLPRTHGSALFTRGETQAVVTVTLGTTRDEQKVDGLRDPVSRPFMLHYNFPPFSVGECRPIRGPGRREIGHGMLAERALEAVLPDTWSFPYTIRIVSDILESNGSSSMATVCGGCLAMMDAGVPLAAPVAGIAMGLVKEGNEIRVLSDILGDEDHSGDMDFKMAGTALGLTAMQMDCKIAGVGRDVMATALEQARRGRVHILAEMAKVIEKNRPDISIFAPRAFKIPINPSKIGMVVGSGGKTIKQIQAETGAQIEISDDGTVAIYCAEISGAERARQRVEDIVREPEVGELYYGKVTSIKPFGCFVEIIPGQEGLVHVSELSSGYVASVRDVVREGDMVWVKVLAVDDNDRVRLSKKAADEEREGREAAPAGSARG